MSITVLAVMPHKKHNTEISAMSGAAFRNTRISILVMVVNYDVFIEFDRYLNLTS